jgi:hypothetical protein
MFGLASVNALIIAFTSSSLYAACFIQMVLSVTGAALVGAVLPVPLDGAPPVVGVGLADPEHADSATAAPATSARIRLTPAG